MEPRRWWPLLSAAVMPLTIVGLSGVGDAPDPHLAAADIAAWFPAHRADIVAAAPFGYLGALAVGAFGVRFARTLRPGPAAAVRAGAGIIAGYFAFLHVTYTTLAYGSEATGLFVATILGVPLFAIGVALLLGGAAASGELPRWLTMVTAAGAAAVVPALVSYGDAGLFSPDVQQQVVGNVFLLWACVAGLTLLRRPRTSVEQVGVVYSSSVQSSKP